MNNSKKKLGYYFAKYRFVLQDDNTCTDVIYFVQNLELRYTNPKKPKIKTFKIKDLEKIKKDNYRDFEFIPVTNFIFLKIKKAFMKRNTYNVKILPNITQYDIRGIESKWFCNLPENTQIEEVVYWKGYSGMTTVHEISERLRDKEYIEYMQDRFMKKAKG